MIVLLFIAIALFVAMLLVVAITILILVVIEARWLEAWQKSLESKHK